MRKKTKIQLLIASFLVVVGALIFVGVMSVSGWDFTKLSTYKFETNTHEITEIYTSIDVSTNEANVELVPSNGEKTSVVCYEKTKIKHSVEIKDGVLKIRAVDRREWYDYIGFAFVSPKITVYIPQGNYDNVTIKTDTGNVKIPDSYSFNNLSISVKTGNVTTLAQAKTLKIESSTGNISVKNVATTELAVSTSTGNISINDVSANNVTLSASTGDISLNTVVATEKLSVKTSTGNVGLTKCDAGEIYISTSTGNVNGSVLTAKNFKANSNTGNVNVPDTITGGLCKIESSTGDIRITIAK